MEHGCLERLGPGGSTVVDFFGGQAEKRRCGNAEVSEHPVELAAMMGLVLGHSAEPFRYRYQYTFGGFAFPVKVGRGERAQV